MCRTPVTLGGGITMTKGFPLAFGEGWNRPCSIQKRYSLLSKSLGSYALASSMAFTCDSPLQWLPDGSLEWRILPETACCGYRGLPSGLRMLALADSGLYIVGSIHDTVRRTPWPSGFRCLRTSRVRTRGTASTFASPTS